MIYPSKFLKNVREALKYFIYGPSADMEPKTVGTIISKGRRNR